MKIELNERELTVVNCCVNIEIKTLEMEKIRLEDRVDALARMNVDRDRKREWQLTPAFLPGEFRGEMNLLGRGPWGHKELDTVE